MTVLARILAFVSAALLSSAAPLVHAQDDGPPNVLVVQREYLKPGKGGLTHERSESAFVRAFAAAKSPSHYFAMDSLSGPPRSLFFISYNSFADWEKDNAAQRADKTLSAAYDHAMFVDGDLLASNDNIVATLRPDLSFNKGHLTGARYFEITTFVVKPGHDEEFEELAHLYTDTFRKVDPAYAWDTFQVMYGNPLPAASGGSIYLIMTLMKSLAEADKEVEDFKKFATTLGPGGMKKVGELTAASIVASATNLFEINPRMSVPEKEIVDAEPAFWKVTPAATAKKPAPKPATP